MNVSDTGSGRPLVFIHGLGWDHTLWHRQVLRYMTWYRVIAGDTRGHGASDKPPGPYSIEIFASDWAALLDRLEVGPACIVGFSQGGMIAQTLAQRRADLVGALVLVSTSARSHPSTRENMEKRLHVMSTLGALETARLAAASIFSAAWREANPEQEAQFIAHRAAQDEAPLCEAMRATYDYDVYAGLDKIAAPTLAIAGLHDTLTKPEAMVELVDRIPDAQLRVVQGSGHMVSIERPADFDALLDEFLAARWPAVNARTSGENGSTSG